jgi:hypothetical protein
MESVTTQRNIAARKTGRSSPFFDWHTESNFCSALGTQALLEAVVHYDQFRAESEGQN